MLAPSIAAVKFDLPSTPEQRACSKSIDEGLQTFWTLVERLHNAADQGQPIHQVEETIFRDLLVAGRWLLQAFLDMSGSGDVGPTMMVAGDSSTDPDQELPRLEQLARVPIFRSSARSALSGPATATTGSKQSPWTPNSTCPSGSIRTCSSSGSGHSWSTMPMLRRFGNWRRFWVWRLPSRHRRTSTESRPAMWSHTRTIYRCPNRPKRDRILVVTADCKGVPLVRSALPPVEATETSLPALANQRRGKGEKANKKKMAAVGAVYTIDPFVRTADEVIDEVMRKQAAKRRPKPAAQAGACRVVGG